MLSIQLCVNFSYRSFTDVLRAAFSEDGLQIGAGLEDLGKGLRSQVGTMYGTLQKGPRYLEMAEGYVTGIALDEDDLSYRLPVCKSWKNDRLHQKR